LLALVLLALAGCSAAPPLPPLAADAPVVDVIGDVVFQRSPRDRYAVLLRGQGFRAPEHAFRIGTAEDVRREGVKVRDRFVEGDLDQLTRLLAKKGYTVYRADMGETGPASVAKLLERIAAVSDGATQVFFAYSGEGDEHGLRTRTLEVGGHTFVPPDATIVPGALLAKLAAIQGTQALLLNACQSGVFTEAARGEAAFHGVVIAACARGYATTPHEPTGTSAIYAAFLSLYRDDPGAVRNLGAVRLERAGDSWTNFRHQVSDFFGGGGLPISYEPVLYSNADFLF
jgi:hypothetical protein